MDCTSIKTSQISAIDRATTQEVNICVDCGTTKTPVWRSGPAGPKTLCNACGIKSRRKKKVGLGLKKENRTKKSSKTVDLKEKNCSEDGCTSSNEDKSCGILHRGSLMKRKFVFFGSERVALQKPRSNSTRRRRQLGEVEQAAILLMALSCDSKLCLRGGIGIGNVNCVG